MSALRFAVGLGMAIEALSNHALAQAAPSGRVQPAAPAYASASAPPSAPTAAANAPVARNGAPDIVRLKNGGFLRGTIAELAPGDFVTLVLVTGETRKIPYADVQYAGAADHDPANTAAVSAPRTTTTSARAGTSLSDAPAVRSESGEIRPFAIVHAPESVIQVKPDGISLFRRSDVGKYEELCTAPCSLSVPAGTHTFAIGKPGGKPIKANPVSLPPGNATVTAAFVDRSAIRITSAVLGVASTAAGIALFVGSTPDAGQDAAPSAGRVLGATGLMMLGVVGVGMLALPDGATITVGDGTTEPPLPKAAPPSHGPEDLFSRGLDHRQRASMAAPSRSALMLTVHF